MERTRVFISYSHRDKKWMEKLRVQLAPLVQDGQLDLWVDTQIKAGKPWREEIEAAINLANVAVLLVSPEFLASEFITQNEVPTLLEAAKARDLPLLCVYVTASMADACQYSYRLDGELRKRSLTDLQGVNSPDRPLKSFSGDPLDRELVSVAKKIRDAAKPQPRVPEADPRLYLEKLRDDTDSLDVRGIGAKEAVSLPLEGVFTRLRVASLHDPDREGAPGKKREPKGLAELQGAHKSDVELKDLLQDHPNLVLVGDPGAGKTTFLRFVALTLARTLLGEVGVSLDRVGLKGEAPFPLLVSLGRFGQFLNDQPDGRYPESAPEHFYRYLDYYLRGFKLGVPETYYRGRVEKGGCMLLLDGLDEVPGQDLRERVAQILEGVVREGQRHGNRHLVTCRTRAMADGRTGPLPDFTRCNLVDFGQEEVELFVRQWYRAFELTSSREPGTGSIGKAEVRSERLLAAIRDNPGVLPLTTNPLMLTILAVVHWNRTQLPEQRAELYSEAVQYLLLSHEGHFTHKLPLRRQCLQAIALRMFEDEAGVRKTLSRREAAEAVASLLNADIESAQAHVEDEELHSGVLVSRTDREVEFWHPTFGEYLAALDLAFEPEYWERIRPRLFDARWNEVVLLLAGCRAGHGVKYAADFIRRILASMPELPDRARAVGLVGRILRDIQPYGGTPAQGTGYAEAVQQVLAIFERGETKVSESVRLEVGEALGQASDPRLNDDDQEDRVFIFGGSFWMGAQSRDRTKPGYDGESLEREAPVHRVNVSTFHIDRYLVTVRRFQRFVEAGGDGYLAPGLWNPMGWRWRLAKEINQPLRWEEQLRHPNWPVTWVSWYEADAYCRWLSAHAGLHVRLPTEAQWEFAARAEKGRTNPWGDDGPTDQVANFGRRIGHVTPVGIYPLGSTPEGVRDLAGNAWEWCADWYGMYSNEEQTDPTGPTKGTDRLLRGGGFDDSPEVLRAAYRGGLEPDDQYRDVGFRCVVVGAGGPAK